MIQLSRLEGFYWVARTGGYARAARSFPYPITQPAVHQQVRKLEAELGKAMFTRIGKDQMMLTDAGRVLYEFCAPFFEGLSPVLRAIEQGRVGGQLRIDAAALEISQVLPRWIKALRRALPELLVVVKEIEEPDYERLRSGQTDLIVDYQPSPPADVQTTRLGTYRSYLIVPRELAPSGRKLELRNMQTAPFASFPPGSSPYALQMAALREAGCAPSMVVNASSVSGILGFVQAGLCYSLVPWADAQAPKLAGVIALELRGDRAEFPVSAGYRKAGERGLIERALSCIEGA
jgi:DNA-binding transcriptional LysR family regulator